MCPLYQFMNRLIDRLNVRYTAIRMVIPSTAWPVWFKVEVTIDTVSA